MDGELRIGHRRAEVAADGYVNNAPKTSRSCWLALLLTFNVTPPSTEVGAFDPGLQAGASLPPRTKWRILSNQGYVEVRPRMPGCCGRQQGRRRLLRLSAALIHHGALQSRPAVLRGSMATTRMP
jgi:hypothetical protein